MNPLKFGTGITGRTYAFRRFRQEGNCVVALGKREDITNEFRREMNNQLQRFIQAGYLEVTHAGTIPLNEFFALPGDADGGQGKGGR